MNSEKATKTALKRLKTEYELLIQNPTEGITAAPVEADFFVWDAVIKGPEGTCYEGGVFNARLTFPNSYPMKPPNMKFTSEMFHPNVYRDGRICISILDNPGDPRKGFAVRGDTWSAIQTIESVIMSVISLLAEPNCQSAANVYAARLWTQDREQYNTMVKRTIERNQVQPQL